MTVLGAVVFGGFLALGVLWLLVTAPESDVDDAWNQSLWLDGTESAGAVLINSSHK
ncbi:hypothetical protein [Mycobacterium sp.]|uniref:hypothetical protein n=1 Tax=Mycobacterium sp. TaxID=1785 RepID=UPI003BAF7C05